MSNMCVKSALHDVNTLMTEKSIISTIDQIEGLLKTGQINEKEFKKKKEKRKNIIFNRKTSSKLQKA